MGYKNPIISGFNPDPSVCRVGGDYYIVTSSFEYFPGLPIYHSRDLVNWTQIGNCIDRRGMLPMEKAQASGGIWAPTIRYSKGTFYVTATFDGVGNFIISTTDPSSSWSDPVWVEMDGIDPSMYFENGKMYYMANDCLSRHSEGISLAEIDVITGKLLSPIKQIWQGTGEGFLEAPHIYHINGWYYLVAAEGGTILTHMVTVAKSKSIWGPYESCPHNPILTNRNDGSKEVLCTGHADLVDDEKGNLWFVHLGTRGAVNRMSHLGRETFLTPVTLSDGWLKADGRKAKLYVDAPTSEQKAKEAITFKDRLSFLHLRSPVMENYAFEDNKLSLTPSKVKITDPSHSPTAVFVRQADFDCTFTVSLDFSPFKDGDEAGTMIYLKHDFMYRFYKIKEKGKNYLVLEKLAEDFNQIVYREETSDGIINIKIQADKEKYTFSYSINESPFKTIATASTRFLCCEVAGKCFTGTLFGMYAQCDNQTTSVAKFNNLHIKTEDA